MRIDAPPRLPGEPPLASARATGLLSIFALGVFVFALRAWLIRFAGSVLPIWDQWDDEAFALYPPWRDGTLAWTQLFALHNEHRIVLTRLADLALFAANAGWNPWAQLLLNAALHAITAAAIAALFWPALERRARVLFACVIAALFASTAGWQNALWGFQSQVYFANALTVAAIAGLCGSAVLDRRWWLGVAAALLALFSDAGGVLASAAVLATLLFALAFNRTALRRSIIAAAILVGLIALGLTLTTSPPEHAALRAHTVARFWSVFTHCLAWPLVNYGWAAAILQLPLACLVADHIRRRELLGPAARCALALGVFAVLHAIAVAYSRGGGLPELRPLSRYQDSLLLGAAAQGFAAFELSRRLGQFGRLLAIAWFATLAAGLILLTETNLTLNLRYKRAQDAANLASIQRYVANGDAAAFLADPNIRALHPDPRVVLRALDDPRVRAVLPRALFASATELADAPPLVVRHAPIFALFAGALLALALALHLRDSDRPDPSAPAPPRPREREPLPRLER